MKWRDRVQEYVRERGEGSLRNLEQARRECQDREKWKLFCRGHPLVGAPKRPGSDSVVGEAKKKHKHMSISMLAKVVRLHPPGLHACAKFSLAAPPRGGRPAERVPV